MHFHMSLSRDLRWICSILIWIDSQKIELRAEPKISWSPLRKLAVLNITKTNKRIRMFHTRVTNVSLDIDYWSHFVEYPDLPVACCLPHLWNSVHEHSWFFFNVWVFVRTSTNFVHLASFQKKKNCGPAHSENAGHFCMTDKWKQSFLYKTQYSVTVVGEQQEHDIWSTFCNPQSPCFPWTP